MLKDPPPNPSQFIIHHLPVIRCYITCAVDALFSHCSEQFGTGIVSSCWVIVGNTAAPSLVGGWSYCAGYQNILGTVLCPSAYSFELNLFCNYQAGIEVSFKYGMQIDVLH
jgi:hypothetical protein